VPFKRREEPRSIEEERDALRQQALALDELKRQLAERVQAVQARERELQQAISEARRGKLPADVPPAPAEPAFDARAAELDRRERALAEREAMLRKREDAGTGETALELEQRLHELELREAAAIAREGELASLAAALEARAAEGEAAGPPDEAQLERVEMRLAELKEAERLFMRTRDELAVRSEAVAARERLVSQRERELDEREDLVASSPRHLSEMEARLKRLEQRQQLPGEQTEGFSGGFRKLQQQGTRPRKGGG
jgi:hypothetical protein